MQFSPTSCLFIPLWSKYSPQQPVLKHPQSMLHSQVGCLNMSTPSYSASDLINTELQLNHASKE
jgi:hypothetical protein